MANKTPKQKEDNITLIGMARALKCNFKTLSEHTKKLVYAGLLDKKNLGDGTVRRSLSPYGKKFIKFIKSFQAESK